MRAVLYDVVLVTGGSEERHVTIERDDPIVKDDTIRYEMDTYQVVRIDPGHGTLLPRSSPNGSVG